MLQELRELVVSLFFNHQERRLRAFWRLLLQFVISSVLLYAATELYASIGGATLGDEAIEGSLAWPFLLAAGGVMSLVMVLFVVWFAGRFFDRRPFSGFGLRIDGKWWLDFGFGLFLGALLMVGVFLVELAAGWLAVTGVFEATNTDASFFPAILAPLVLFVCVGIYEELVSRGYQLRNMAEGLNFPGVGPKGAVLLAWVLSSSIFGLLHFSNPNATVVSTVSIALAGLLLGAGYVLTGQLGIPIGLHMTWNFFQGNVFGFPVSGLEPVGATFLSIEQVGPPLFTGGAFGPEAGLLGIAAMIVGILLIWLWVQARSGKVALQASLAEPPAATTARASVSGPGN